MLFLFYISTISLYFCPLSSTTNIFLSHLNASYHSFHHISSTSFSKPFSLSFFFSFPLSLSLFSLGRHKELFIRMPDWKGDSASVWWSFECIEPKLNEGQCCCCCCHAADAAAAAAAAVLHSKIKWGKRQKGRPWKTSKPRWEIVKNRPNFFSKDNVTLIYLI